MSEYREPSHDQIHQRGSEGPCPPEGGESSPPSPSHEQIEIFGGGIPGVEPNGDNSSPAVGSVELHGQGDQRNYADQSEMTWPGDMRVKEGGPKSDPTEAMPGA